MTALAVGTLVTACTPAEETAEEMQARMEEETAAFTTALGEMEARYERYENGRQADSTATIYTEDGVAAFPYMPPLRGREAIRTTLTQIYSFGTPSLDIRVESAVANGPLGVERGTYVLGFTPRPTAPPGLGAMYPDSGSYLAHWRLVNGEWKLAELVVSSMKAPPGMGM